MRARQEKPGKIHDDFYSLLHLTLHMKSKLLLCTTLSLTAAVASCLADKAADLKPTLIKPGKAIVEDAFDATALGKNWSAAKGDWQPREGTLVGKEKKEDKHPAVLMLAQPNRNSAIRFAFKLDGVKSMALSLNSAKGHLFRVTIQPESLVINKDKDKKDPASKTEVLGKAAAKFGDGQWHTLLVEMQGANVAVQTDNGVKLAATNAGLDVDKTGYRFVTAGASLLVDDVKVWEVLP